MSRGGALIAWPLGGAALAVVGLLTVPFVRYAEWRRRKDKLGERFGNGSLERLRKRRDGSSYRPGGERVELDPGSGLTGDGETRA